MQQRLQRHLLAQLVTLGEHNITGLLCACGRQSLDWSSDYRMYSRQRVEPERLFQQVRTSLLEQLPPEEPVVVALDDTHIRKSGIKVAGAKYVRDPLGPPFHVNFIWAQRFPQLSMACGAPPSTRMIPIGWQHVPTPKKPRAKPPDAEREAYRQACREQSLGKVATAQLRQTRKWLDYQGQQKRELWCVVDGGYTNRTDLKHLPESIVLVGRLRADAQRASVVAPAQRSPTAQHKAQRKRTGDGLLVHSFQTLLSNLATITKNQMQMGDQSFQRITTPTKLRQRAFELLQVPCR